jgi:hypothetical protein
MNMKFALAAAAILVGAPTTAADVAQGSAQSSGRGAPPPRLRELQASVPELTKLGYQILAVSTDTPEEILKFNADSHLSYTLLSDTRLEVAARFGLR